MCCRLLQCVCSVLQCLKNVEFARNVPSNSHDIEYATLLQHSCNTPATEQQLFCVCEWRKKWLLLVALTSLYHVCPIILYFYLVHGHGIVGHHVYVTIQAQHTPAFHNGRFCGRVDGEDVAGSGVENQQLLQRRTRPGDEIDETILRENSPMMFCNGRS